METSGFPELHGIGFEPHVKPIFLFLKLLDFPRFFQKHRKERIMLIKTSGIFIYTKWN